MRKNQQDMLDDIDAEVRYTRSLIGKDALDPRVMEAVRKVPRDEFVPPDMKSVAFENGPLPIGHGQTISQPYIVALMTDMVAPEPEHRILEIGTGSGYQTAILSQLCSKVYSVEVVAKLSTDAAALLKRLGYHNIETRIGDGYHGWPEHAPYDGIIVTAAATYIPEALIEQLKPGGRMAIPVGLPYSHQELMLVRKDEHGKMVTESVLGVAFVPLVDGESVSRQ
ncbi:MAG: protein-L-isoaspartate(D-aspartate) O-methyltransferase [Gammaproteobacteria bacterium]|nr:MAG: protein-L-isoaspartate(D-aspartate) O-methyltransferase [Gammaproteobacteria bacterium]